MRTRIKRQGGERTGRREEENRGGAEKGEEEKTRETGQKGKERKTGKPVEREANKQKQKKKQRIPGGRRRWRRSGKGRRFAARVRQDDDSTENPWNRIGNFFVDAMCCFFVCNE